VPWRVGVARVVIAEGFWRKEKEEEGEEEEEEEEGRLMRWRKGRSRFATTTGSKHGGGAEKAPFAAPRRGPAPH
jgi:hypothetical protein